ncbi:MAG TPA: MaoC/PaaZ C-terminal domain-containing protein [Smithellaceae bacterium]|nr:MaoC/PaaZ C-terminal domain-containing protein [Smithellaceae bacterium]HRS83597.1 MaoC/PaaZ C-terminal domain-containing protein [Smithellaceae bacterium]
MKLTSDYVGTPLKEYTCTVDARRTMNYAAAIGDAHPAYFDDEQPGGIIAPPLFPVALTWPAVENIGEDLQARAFPREVLLTQVHYSEHLSLHRPLVPGMRLVIQGAVAAILPHRAGTYVVIRFDARDDGGRSIFTEHLGAMMRGVECADAGKGGQAVPSVPVHVDESVLWESVIPIDPLAPFIYDGCTNIYFPIHTSVQFAHQVGLPGIIYQGTATLAVSVHHLLKREAGGDSRSLTTVFCGFSGMVMPGSSIRVCLTGRKETAEATDLFFTVLNAEGKKAIRDGYMRLKN